MATVPYPGATGITGKTEAATFIPEIWSDEIIAAYQKNLKMVPLVKKLSMTGKKGDKLHIPKPTRADASVKAENAAVNIIANTESELAIDVNRHFEYSRLIEDIVEVQALNSLRQFYTEDAGYALATKIDTDLHAVATGFGDGTMTLSPVASSYQNSAAFFNNNGTTTAFTGQSLPANTAFDDGKRNPMNSTTSGNKLPLNNQRFAYVDVPEKR